MAHSAFLVCLLIWTMREVVRGQEIPSMAALYDRSSRSFPYSMSLVNLVPSTRERENMYVASSGWKAGEEDLDELLESLQRERRSIKQKRYACRFKFCRIFDS